MTSGGLPPEVAAHYGEDSAEEERLGSGAGRLEFLRTWELLQRHLPPPPARVLDIGGAAGVYTFPLAAAGYDVDLIDPVERHVALARQRAAVETAAPTRILQGNATDLPYHDARVDAVLLLGPLYHLTERQGRLVALREAHRVLRPGGSVIGAAISRFASTCDGLARGLLHQPGFEDVLGRDLRSGQHRNPDRRPDWFTTAYFHLPDELVQEVSEAGFDGAEVFAVEGPAWLLPRLDEDLASQDRRDRVLRALRRIEREPSLLGASAHLLVTAVRPRGVEPG